MFRHLFDESVPIPKATQPQKNTAIMPVVPRQTAALDNHIRLQQSQEEFLVWLEEQKLQDQEENKTFRKIR